MTTTARALLVVPCYNEERRLDVAAFDAFLANEPRIDVLFVNDGSTDDTRSVLADLRARHPRHANVLTLQRNSGKAEAVRQGVLHGLAGHWDFIGYWDADLSTPLGVAVEWVDLLDRTSHIDWVFGARIRLLGRSIRRSLLRHLTGRAFATAASMAVGLPVYDTQCGAKLFRRTANAYGVFAQTFRSRWAFDVEILSRVQHLHRARTDATPFPVLEVPLLRWHDDGDSRLRARHMVRATTDLLRIAIDARFGRTVPVATPVPLRATIRADEAILPEARPSTPPSGVTA